MPKVDLTATKDFTYMTRRLTAGDAFQARNPLEAKILTRVRKVAEVTKPLAEGPSHKGGRIDAPTHVQRPAPPAPSKKPAAKKAPAKRKARAKK